MSIYKEDSTIKSNILKIVSDKMYRDILVYLIKKRSVTDISRTLGIPKSTIYRIVNELNELDLIKIACSNK